MSGDIHAVSMPKLGLTMEEGMVTAWKIAEGGAVAPGDVVLEVEIEKSTNELETRHGGILRRRVAREGDTLPIGALLGVIAGPEVPDAAIDAFIAGHGGG